MQDGVALNFRYDVKPKTRVSVFEPNRADGDPMNMRGTVIGGLAKESLNRLPKSPMASVLWEVFWMHQNPLSMFIHSARIDSGLGSDHSARKHLLPR